MAAVVINAKAAPCVGYKQGQRRGERQIKNDGHGMREAILHARPQTCEVTGSAWSARGALNGGSYAFPTQARLRPVRREARLRLAVGAAAVVEAAVAEAA